MSENPANVLKERARKLAARGTEGKVRVTHDRVVLVEAGGVRYGLPLRLLRTVTRAPGVALLPHVPGHIAGLCALGGELVTVVDLAELRGTGRVGSPMLIAVVEVEKRVVGLLFDSLLSMLDIFADELVEGLGTEDLRRSFLRGLTQDGTHLLDMEHLLLGDHLLVGQPAVAEQPSEQAP